MGRHHARSIRQIPLLQLHPFTRTLPNYTHRWPLENIRQSMETPQRSTSRPTRSFKPIKYRTKQVHPQVILPTTILFQRNRPTPSRNRPCHRPPSVNNTETPLAAGTRRSIFLAQRDPWWYHAPCPFTLLIFQHLITYMILIYSFNVCIRIYQYISFHFQCGIFPTGLF